MLEGSFRPPSAASAGPVQLHLYSSQPASSAYPADQALARRKDPGLQPPHNRGPSFTPIAHHQHSPGYDTDDHPPSPQPRFYHHHQPPPGFRASEPGAPQPLKSDSKPSEPAAKDPSFGPVRAKKKPAGSACNSCHRLKTRCSGGYPCDRCAAHKVPCQFDRDLIYRSPLASSSQQASARNAQVLNQVNGKLSEPIIVPTKPPRARSNNGTAKPPNRRPGATPPVQHQQHPQQIPPVVPITALPNHVETATQLPRSTPSPVPVRQAQPPPPPPHQQQALAHPSNGVRKQGPPKSTNAAPAPSEAFVTYDPNSLAAMNPTINTRLTALENNLSNILQILRPQASHSHSRLVMPDQIRSSSPTPAPPPPPMLMASSSNATGPERDRHNDSSRLGLGAGSGDLLIDAILDPTQIQYLYDIFVDYCLPSLPILHRVQLSMIRARSPFLFSTMLAIGARFCSAQSVAHPSSSLAAHSVNSTPSPIGSHSNAPVLDEPTYARLVTLAYQHLSSTVLKSCHSLDDVRAILFLACWALVSNEDGPPSRWILVGHAGRIARSMGLERLARDLNGSGGWANAQQHAIKRDQLDAIKTDYAIRSMEAFLSTTLRLEPTRDYFPKVPDPGCSKANIVQLATGSPFQYDVLSTAQIQAMVELAEIWAEASSFLAAADDRNRKLSAEQLVELGERHNTSLDGWAQKWTWHGSSWAPLLGNNLRTVRLLSESLRITLNLALTNVLYACITAAAGNNMFTTRFQETLSIALERVNGSSTAVIQAHRDSAREGFSLAFAPDLITDGLVSAALTVLQLATPFAHGVGRTQPSTTSGGQLLAEEERPATPSEKGDVEMSDVTTTTNKSSSGRHQSSNTAISSPATSPGSGDQSSHSGDGFGKRPLMEPAVAAHYIRMATDVLRTSDRSQTRLGTTMACKIMSLAGRAGLLPGVVVGAQNQQQQQQPQQRLKTVDVERKAEAQEQMQDKKRRRSEESVEEGPSRVQSSSIHGGEDDGSSSRRQRSISSEKTREEEEDGVVVGDNDNDEDEDEQAVEQDDEDEEDEEEEEAEDHLLIRTTEEHVENGSDDDEILGECGVEDHGEDAKMMQEEKSHDSMNGGDEEKILSLHEMMECEDDLRL